MMFRIRFRSSPPQLTDRTALIQDLFGVGRTPHTVTIADNLTISLDRGKILLITGASGTGKSSLLKAMKRRLKTSVIDADRKRFPSSSAIIDSIPGSFSEVLGLLSMVGLGEAHLMLRPYTELSEGQKLRARIAYAVAKSDTKKVILIDEFCSTLDRLTAYVVSYNLRRLVDRLKLSVVVATALDDILYDLQPDEHLFTKRIGVWRRKRLQPRKRPISFFKRLSIRQGERRDWENFASFHYKSHALGIIDKIYLLHLDGEPIGIVVYAFPQAGCSLRNRVTGNRYAGTAVTIAARKRLLNKEVRVVQRIVIDPRFRGLGLAAALLRSTIPLLGVRFVECLAVMGGYSRFLQKAGFMEVGRMELPREGRILLGELRSEGLDETELHDEERLKQILRKRCEKSGVFGELLRRWFGQRSFVKGARSAPKHRKESLDKMAKAVVESLTSRPFYFICDTESFKEKSDENGETENIPVEGERLESKQDG